MRAARVHRLGGPGVILCEELSRPDPTRAQVLVRVAAIVLALLGSFAVAGSAVADQQGAVPTLSAAPPASLAGLPIRVRSVTSENRLEGSVDGTVDHDFAAVSALLARPEVWCELLPLHLNVKACVYSSPVRSSTTGAIMGPERSDDPTLSLYLGRKFYQEPQSGYRLDFRFEVQRADREGLAIALRAARGPFGTHDYTLAFTAAPKGDGRTELHLQYAYGFGLVSRLAMSTYLHTAGRSKVGFTIEGRDDDGRPVYVGGLRGVIERNAVRYHLAIQAYLDTRDQLEPASFRQLLTRWYELTNAYPDQLYEVDESSYLADKQRERADQLRLQAETMSVRSAGPVADARP